VEDIMASIAQKAAQLAAAQADANAQADGNVIGADGSNAGSLAASKSPLGNQLPQPSVKVSRFTVPPKGTKESTADYNMRVLAGMMGQRRLQHTERQPTAITIPIVMQEAGEQQGVSGTLSGLSESVKRLEMMFETRQRLLEDGSAAERSARLTALLQKEDETVKALNRLAESFAHEPAPLLPAMTDITMAPEFREVNIVQHPKHTRKTGKATRNSDGTFSFEVEEKIVEETNGA
jgi:hypothetical protein